MASNKSTPEKRLLELIESPNNHALREVKKKRSRVGFLSLSVFKGRFSFLKEGINKSLKGKTLVDIRGINIILTICVLSLMLYLGMSWLDSTDKLNKISNLSSEIAAQEKVKPFLSVSLLKDSSYYLQKVGPRNIFELAPEAISKDIKEEASVEEEVVTPKDELLELIKDLVLVGVSWSDDPVAMIENTDAKITYFLRKGEELKEGVKIRQIFMDRVILEYKGEEVELKI